MRWFIVVILSVTIACAASTHPFEPTKKQKVIPQLGAQHEIRSGMECVRYYRIMLDLCYSEIPCSMRQMRQYSRDLRRVKTSTCHIYFGKQAQAILRGR